MAQGITLAKAIDYFSRELGCTDREVQLDNIAASIEYMLLNGGGDILREWKVVVRDGKFTFPRDLETPVKYKFSRLPNSGFGTVHSAYYSYSSDAVKNCCDYANFDSTQIEVKANRVATRYQPPCCGMQLVATTRNDRDVGKKIMVSGTRRGMDIAPLHNNFKTAGELLTIYKEDDNKKKYSEFIFNTVTSVTKDETCDYVTLSGIDQSTNSWYFLSHYHPDEETPSYVQGELFACPGWCCDAMIHVLGRVCTGIRHIRDEEVLPITSIDMLRLLAKRIRYDDSGDFKEVAAMEQRIQILIRKQVAYQQEANIKLSYNLASSGASLTNL